MKPRKPRALPPGIYLDRGKFLVKIRLNGKMSPSATFESLAEAVEHLELLRQEAAKIVVPERASGATLGEWIDEWIEIRKNSKRYRDVKNDENTLARYVPEKLRARGVRELRQRDIRAWLFDLGNREATRVGKDGRVGKGRPLSRQTIANALNLLRACLEDAVRAGRASANPALALRPPRSGGVTREHTGYIPMPELDALFALPDLPLMQRTFFSVALYVGMRAGEICGLRWEDVTLDGPRPEVLVRFSRDGATKTGHTRRVPLIAQARAALATWRDQTRADEPLVFPAARARKNGSRCHAKGFDADWRTWAERVGIDLPFKQLRHSCGSHLVQGTWGPPLPLSTVQGWLGHTSITTTERFYARFAPGHLHAAREALDRRDPPPEPPKTPGPKKPRKGK